MKNKQRRVLVLKRIFYVGVILGLTAFQWCGCKTYERPVGVTQIPGRAYGVPLNLRGAPAESVIRSISAPGGLPSAHEELWIIAKSGEQPPGKSDEVPGSGVLMTKLPQQEKEVPLPLRHTSVKGSINGYIATVDVTQQFQNPYDAKIEAVYVFPLPENAAVNEFLMRIGDRLIRGIIRERSEAEAIYREAKSQGYVASLLTQERPNIFTQSVANIEPGKAIDIEIKYFHTLSYVDGWYEFVFPMVVGPRYNPPGSTAGVGAVARGNSGNSGQSTEVQYLRPGERSGHDVSLQLEINAGVTIEEVTSRGHAVKSTVVAADRRMVELSPADSIPNKDFIIRYRVAGDRIKSNLLTHHDERGGFFTLMLYPPQTLENLERQPLEMVFLLDCSGSMSGEPIKQAKTAIERTLLQLRPDDSFQIVNFSEKASALGARPIEATMDNVRRGLNYLRSLNGDGPTQMIEGIKAALDFSHDLRRLRFVCFMTDGFIGNEAEILREVRQRLGESRIFSFGVGSAPNRYLLDGLARIGRGAVAYLGPRDDSAAIMDRFVERISHPALIDLQVDWGGSVTDVFPDKMPDMFVGRAVVLTGRYAGNSAPTVQVIGRAGGQRVVLPVLAGGALVDTSSSALPSVWARLKIAALSDHALVELSDDSTAQIKQTALDFSLMSAFTAFVAVDSSRRTEGTEGTTVPVAVPVPQGTKYRTTVPEN